MRPFRIAAIAAALLLVATSGRADDAPAGDAFVPPAYPQGMEPVSPLPEPPPAPTPPLVPAEAGAPFAFHPRPRESFALHLRVDFGADWFRSTTSPSFASDPEALGGRDVAAHPLPRVEQPVLLRFALDTSVVANERWLLPLFGFSLANAIGSRAAVVTSSDGSMVTMHPARMGAASFLLPGLGMTVNDRRWTFAADARLLATYTWINVTVANGGSSSDVVADAWTLGVRASLSGCRRIDPTERACVVLEPHVYEGGWLNGGGLSLRWETGR